MSNRLCYNGISYAINLNKILKFYSDTESNKNKETEIVDTYEIDSTNVARLIGKQIREAKSNQPAQNETIKYDLIKMFLTVLLDNDNRTTDVDLGTNLAFNTLLENDFIYEITD